MSQTWTTNAYESTHSADTDLANMEANFATLKSNFSGTSQPSDAVAGMSWFDTTKKLLKHRNNANGAWRGILAGSASLKLWLYLAAAEDGWVIDSSIADVVLAVKSASGTYATAGATAGSWTISGLSSVGTAVTLSYGTAKNAGTLTTLGVDEYNYLVLPEGAGSLWYGEITRNSGTHNHTVSHDGTSRPAAAVGTIQYPDV